ncbi:MAG: arylsulfatase [Planctomycetota bacterium]|jgi:arylsulfatase A-like enzyme|nr:arylsulfatase [Planctomycetota bacterium]
MEQAQQQHHRPNVILVMTDDQGYGDLGCTGNTLIHTPNIDAFHRECTRLTDFHVSPLCTPTRGALMTGHNPLRNGAWATTWGRSMLRKDEVTMANVFSDSGYKTGMFGKWHLGDNYPYRPQDRGFQTVVAHRGGGVGQTPDFWGNDYFDDTYRRNGNPEEFEGYCTDIWFDEALRFIEESGDEPFFCYLATNAPHSPYLVADRYKEPYLDNDRVPNAAFYGMITNIDENMGRLIQRLEKLGIAENTILIFMTDNGTSAGWSQGKGYNAGMRGTKGSYYDGGHRVPFFTRWPAGGIAAGEDICELVTHMDLLPTFIDLCGLESPAGVEFDGQSIAPLLTGESSELPDRTHFVQYRQSTHPPEKWDCAVMTRQWRLVAGNELYDVKADPGQERNVASDHPEVVEDLRAAHEAWWDEVSPGLDEYCPITIGSDDENPLRLDAFDLMGDVAWNQSHVRQALKVCGAWAVDVERGGTYEMSVQRWSEEVDLPITEALVDSVTIDPAKVRLRVGEFEEERDVPRDAKAVIFRVPLDAGITRVEANFIDAEGESYAAYYVYVKRLTT